MLTATALVLFMTIPGLSLFYAGLVRAKNVLSVLMQCFAITGLMSLLWFVAGYSIAFGTDGVEPGAYMGVWATLFLANVSMDSMRNGIPETLFVMFQMTFAVITPALIVGGFAERMKFSAMLLFSAAWMLLVYAPVCHWVWGGGWLGNMGLQDFAGGTVVHTDCRCRSPGCRRDDGIATRFWPNCHATTQPYYDGYRCRYALGRLVWLQRGLSACCR